MPEETEIETRELQEAIDEIHKERGEREAEEKATAWTRYISLSTALLAVFAAIGALQSGSLVNEAMISQLKASDTWNEYQAARQKSHLYTLNANTLIDAGLLSTKPVSGSTEESKWSPKPAKARAHDYESQVKKEDEKAKGLREKAKKLEEEAHALMKGHEKFAVSVAFIQVAIALGAISALTRIKPVWLVSLIVGAAGIYAFVAGFIIK